MEYDKNTTKTIDIDPVLLGKRIEAARKAKGMLQEEAANKFRCSRPTYIKIEKGTRPVSEEELTRLADIFDCDVKTLTEPEQVASETVSKRILENAKNRGLTSEKLERATDSFQRFADACTRLDKLNGTSVRKNLPPQRSISRRYAETLAETFALQERNRLGLGEQPLDDLRNLLEIEVGIRCLYDDLPLGMAGLFGYTNEAGAVVLVNRNQRPEERLWTLIRCYGLMLCERKHLEVVYADTPEKRDPKERFADRFATCFLIPAAGVLRRYYCLVEMNKDFLVADLLQMSRSFHVLPERMVQRLAELRLVSRDIVGQFRQNEKEESPSDDSGMKDEDCRFSDRYITQAVRAFRDGKLIKELADILRTDNLNEAEKIKSDWLQGKNGLLKEGMDCFAPVGSLVEKKVVEESQAKAPRRNMQDLAK